MKTRASPLNLRDRLGVGIALINRHPVKLTALLYLREALLQERYEECAQAIKVAGEFGAKAFEIQNLLEDPRRMPRG